MKLGARSLLLAWFAAVPAHAEITNFTHVVVVFQENRTPDSLFQGLCNPPYGNHGSCSTTPTLTQYNIQTTGWLNNHSPSGKTQPTAVPLANNFDLGHSHKDFVNMCDLTAGSCAMDGACYVTCGPQPCPSDPQFKYVDNSEGILDPYLELATQYGWANFMLQTKQGPSFPAHQFIFGGTSAPSALDDSKAIFASENMKNGGVAGCIATDGSGRTSRTTVELLRPPPRGIESTSVYPCFEHDTMPDLFPSKVTWKYYAPGAGSVWTAPNAIKHICVSSGPGGNCTGAAWKNNVDLTPADVLVDIANCELRSVSLVIPTAQNSDHARINDGGGPSWVAAIVNAIGNDTNCDASGYGKDTAIFITWDDWGGWYDHEPPTILPGDQGNYQYGFRVPMMVVSAYTPEGYINNNRHDFGSILRFIQHNFGIAEGALNFADERSITDLTGFFDLKLTPRAFKEIVAPEEAVFFLQDKRLATDPDDE